MDERTSGLLRVSAILCSSVSKADITDGVRDVFT
jgi:hypothetical protein